MQLNHDELGLILEGLSDYEQRLCVYWAKASEANSTALLVSLCEDLRQVRNLADRVSTAILVPTSVEA
jgi:hypothetical protein